MISVEAEVIFFVLGWYL